MLGKVQGPLLKPSVSVVYIQKVIWRLHVIRNLEIIKTSLEYNYSTKSELKRLQLW
jgi:hypothetical protein